MIYPHAVIWLDHREATVIKFSPDASESHVVHSHHDAGKLHRKAGSSGSGHVADDVDFFDAIVRITDRANEVLVVGPGLAKVGFERHIRDHHATFAQRVVGVETADHPTPGELLAHARQSFKGIDQLRG